MSDILIDSRLFEKEYVFESDAGSARMNAGLFTNLFINLRLKGWEGGRELFDASFEPAGVKMNSLKGSYAISSNEAQDLGRVLGELVGSSKASQEFTTLVEPILSIASQGAFVIHT